MIDMKRNVLFLCMAGVGIIFLYQFYLNFNKTSFKTVINTIRETHLPIIAFGDHEHHMEDDSSVALRLSREVRVLCWVMTSPSNHRSKALHVMATWGKRCNKLLFSTESFNASEGLPVLLINTTEGREHLTAKTMQSFDHLYRNHLHEYDWFMKADDDTYVILENLRYFLSSKDPTKPVYFGHHFHKYVHQGYFSGGGGYVMSRAGLKQFGERKSEVCKSDHGAEDVEIGKCMELVGVVAGDSRDALGRSRFHCFTPMMHISGGYPDWYYIYDTYGGRKGIASISDYAITFHYVDAELMYVFDFFLFHLRPYGIHNYPQNLNVPNGSTTETPLNTLPTTTLPPDFVALKASPASIFSRQTPNVDTVFQQSSQQPEAPPQQSSQQPNTPSQQISQKPITHFQQHTTTKKHKRRKRKKKRTTRSPN